MPLKKSDAEGKATIKRSESSPPKPKSVKNKNIALMEPSDRTLRPRKVLAVAPQPAKKKAAVIKNDANGVASTKKESGDKRRKIAPATSSAEGEPLPKAKKTKEKKTDSISAPSIYDFKANTIEGKEISLSKYKGHVCVIVNVASKCGHTASNYKELVELYNKYGDAKGLRILAFPCNQFGKQEPGDNEKICEFAKKKNVEFDMFEKVNVNGKDAHPLWNYLTSQKDGPKGAKIDWNFTKFLISKDGQVVNRFKSAVKPLSLVEELEKLW